MAIFDSIPYREFDVLINTPNELEKGQLIFERIMQDVDNKIAIPYRYDSAGTSFPKQKFVWFLPTRKDKIRFYKLLYRIRGRQKAMWVPSFSDDIVLATDCAPGDHTIDIQNIGIASITGVDSEQKHLVFMLHNGTFRYRRILASVEVDKSVETLTLNQAFGGGLAMSAVKMICFMRLARLDNDLVEIRHTTDMNGVAEAALVFKTVWDRRNVRP